MSKPTIGGDARQPQSVGDVTRKNINAMRQLEEASLSRRTASPRRSPAFAAA